MIWNRSKTTGIFLFIFLISVTYCQEICCNILKIEDIVYCDTQYWIVGRPTSNVHIQDASTLPEWLSDYYLGSKLREMDHVENILIGDVSTMIFISIINSEEICLTWAHISEGMKQLYQVPDQFQVIKTCVATPASRQSWRLLRQPNSATAPSITLLIRWKSSIRGETFYFHATSHLKLPFAFFSRN